VKVVLLGATKGMGRALARLMAERGDELFLLGRDPSDLQRCATDLEIRGAAGDVRYATCDLLRPQGFGDALDAASRQLGGLEAIVLTAGVYATQEALEEDAAALEQLLTVDFTRTIEFCEHARRRLLQGKGGVLCVFSSVAGDRARKSRMFYGAAKAGLSYYLEGLDLKYHDQGLHTVIVKPGFVRTTMTAGAGATLRRRAGGCRPEGTQGHRQGVASGVRAADVAPRHANDPHTPQVDNAAGGVLRARCREPAVLPPSTVSVRETAHVA
jgi:short-subunit dehydrogenase